MNSLHGTVVLWYCGIYQGQQREGGTFVSCFVTLWWACFTCMYLIIRTYNECIVSAILINRPFYVPNDVSTRRQYTKSVLILHPTPRDGNKVATNWCETEENQIHRKLQCNANVPRTKGQQEQAKIRIKHAELNLREGVSK